MINGAYTALITPFNENNEIDMARFLSFVQWQIDSGIDGVVVAGTTGESATMSHDEHMEIVYECAKLAKGRVHVMAGTGSNSTAEAVELSKHAQQCSVDSLLVVTPYYNKPCQRGMFKHYATIAEAVDIPIIVYNIPGRSVVDLLPETLAELKKAYPGKIIGVKDATGCLERVAKQRRACGGDFIQMSGNDATAIAFNAQGGHGCISVTSNIAPALCKQMQEACKKGDYKAALEINDRLCDLHEALFIEPNPAGAKYAAWRLGLCSPAVRSPMLELSEETKKIIDAAMVRAGIL